MRATKILVVILLAFVSFGCSNSNTSLPPKNKALARWLSSEDPKFVDAIVSDIERHVDSLRSNGQSFCGYAILPGDYRTQPEPASIVVAFSRESELTDDFSRFSVNDWQNFVYDGFAKTNSELKSLLNEFRDRHTRIQDGPIIDDYEVAYIEKIDRAILNALLELKRLGVFTDDQFIVIWYSNADCDIVNDSARQLNVPDTYKKFKTQFGD